VTSAGCGAICPGYHRGCYGCFGPKELANTSALSAQLEIAGMKEADLVRAFRQINGYNDVFRKESEAHER
jgi:hypothetical protein